MRCILEVPVAASVSTSRTRMSSPSREWTAGGDALPSGTVNQKVLPPEGSLDIPSSPPIIATRCRGIDNPSPFACRVGCGAAW